MDPLEDGGFASRKFVVCAGAAFIIVTIGLLAGTVMPGVAGLFTEIIGGVLGCAGLFVTGNIASRYVVAKSNPNVSFQGELPSQDGPKTAPKPPGSKPLPEPGDGPEDQE